MKKLISIISIFLVLFSPVLFCACKEDPPAKDLSFKEVSDFILAEDVLFREFSKNLKASNAGNEKYDYLASTLTTLENLVSSLTVQLDEYDATLTSVAGLGENNNLTITKTTEKISVITPSQSMEANMDTARTKVSLVFTSGETNYVLELKSTSSGYVFQMAYKQEGENYSIYRYKFNGVTGVLATNYATSFTPIYDAEVDYNSFPEGAEFIFYT